MVLKVSAANDVNVYTVSGAGNSKSLPDWLARKRKRSLKHDPEYSSRIELLQDFEFPEASNKIKVSKDGKFAMATGTYKPQIHVYEFAELGIKFSRHTDAENIDLHILSEDWTKSVHLQNNRTLEFHTQGGIYYRVRIPRFGTQLAYNEMSCDLYVSAVESEVYRLNLERGQFLQPWQTDSVNGVNSVSINQIHRLVALGCANGNVEFWDPRIRDRVATLNVSSHVDEHEVSVTAQQFHKDGLSFAAGTNTGHCLLYDLRSKLPVLTKDQGYSQSIRSIQWVECGESTKLVSADSTIIKIWDRIDGKPFTSIEPSVGINDVCLVPDSGMILTANEGISMYAFYVPQLGQAPKWCRFLDNITEELEENTSQAVYDNYKFITRKELTALGIDHLIGTNVVRSYMHGFFIDLRLYDQARLIANPFIYEEHRQKAINEKIEKDRESRIHSSKVKTKVNRQLAQRLLQNEKPTDNKEDQSILSDERFKRVFEDPEFEVDETTFEYKQLHPNE